MSKTVYAKKKYFGILNFVYLGNNYIYVITPDLLVFTFYPRSVMSILVEFCDSITKYYLSKCQKNKENKSVFK